MKPVSFHPEAIEEMLYAARYYEEQQPDLGKRFVDAVQTSVRHIQINASLYPARHPPQPDPHLSIWRNLQSDANGDSNSGYCPQQKETSLLALP